MKGAIQHRRCANVVSPKTSLPFSSSSGNSIRPSARHETSETSNEAVGQTRDPPTPNTTSQCLPVNPLLQWQVNCVSIDCWRRLESIGMPLKAPGVPVDLVLSMHWPPFKHGQLAHGPAGAVAHFASDSVLQCAQSVVTSEDMLARGRQPPLLTNVSTHTVQVRCFGATTPKPSAVCANMDHCSTRQIVLWGS